MRQERSIVKKNQRGDSAKDMVFRRIAHFLLLNSEVTNAMDRLHLRAVLLHFLFQYAHRYEKQHYADFAFELLQVSLSNLMGILQKEKKVNLNAILFGQSLINFIDNGFFESDELSDILLPFDSLAIYSMGRFSRGEFSPTNLKGLLVLCGYFLDRIGYLDDDSNNAFDIKKHLFIAFFELIHHMDVWDGEDIASILLMEMVLERCLRQREMAPIAKNGLQRLKNDIMPNNKVFTKLYREAKTNDDLDLALLLSSRLSEKIDAIANDKKRLWLSLESKTLGYMEKLYNGRSPYSISDMNRATAYGLSMILESSPYNLTFPILPIVGPIEEK